MYLHSKYHREWFCLALRELLLRFLDRSRGRADERRVEEERVRFWEQLREGEREAEAREGE